MASIADVPTAESTEHAKRMGEMRDTIALIVEKAGGEVCISALDYARYGASRPRDRLMFRMDGITAIYSVAPADVHIDGISYWVKVEGKSLGTDAWIPATRLHGKWWLVGMSDSVTPTEIGNRIARPDDPDDPDPPKGPPEGYRKLAAGVRCRCVRLWADLEGNHYCCRPAPELPAGALGEGRTALSTAGDPRTGG